MSATQKTLHLENQKLKGDIQKILMKLENAQEQRNELYEENQKLKEESKFAFNHINKLNEQIEELKEDYKELEEAHLEEHQNVIQLEDELKQELEEKDDQCMNCGTTCLDHTSNKGRGSESPCEDCEEHRCKYCPCECSYEEEEEDELKQELEDDTPCNPPCKTRPMIGRSWWKNQGYNSPCGCAVNAHNKKYPQSKIEKIKW